MFPFHRLQKWSLTAPTPRGNSACLLVFSIVLRFLDAVSPVILINCKPLSKVTKLQAPLHRRT